MTVNTINQKQFELLDDQQLTAGSLVYSSSAFNDALIDVGESYSLNYMATGIWVTHLTNDKSRRARTLIRVETGGLMSISLPVAKKKYFFKKSSGWKLRFSVSNKDGEDLLTLIPNLNWQKESHDYILQLNEEFEKECDAFLILQAVHCANCSLSMMTGGPVPALVSI